MAYDKVVDSTALETAIAATANAIREKTGDTALLEWVASKGFADAIAGISGGAIVETGSFVVAEEVSRYDLALSKDNGNYVDVLAVFAIPNSGNGGRSGVRVFLLVRNSGSEYAKYTYGYMASANYFPLVSTHSESSTDVVVMNASGEFKTDVTYKWLAIWGATI